MADEILKRDQNSVPVLGAVTNDSNQEIRMLRVNPVTGKLLVDTGLGALGGLVVNDTSAATANKLVIQTAVSSGGPIQIANQGIVYINGTIVVPKNTTINVLSGCTIKMLNPGTNVPMFVNSNWQSVQTTATNGVSDYGSGWYIFNVTGVTVTPTYGAIYTNSGANFLVISTSITAGAGTVTCYSTGQPSTSGVLTKTSGTGDATVTFSSRTEVQKYLQGQRTATVDFGANTHGLSNGDWFTLKGDTTRKYLGIWQVLNVINANKVSFSIPGDTAGLGNSSGTITSQKADANIYFTGGGVLDYNGVANQNDYGYNCMLMIMNNVRNLNVFDLTLLNSPKYCIYWINLHGARFNNLTIQGASAAIQGLGFGLDIQGNNVMGMSADDFIAWTNDNNGFTQFDFPNINSFGPLIGFTWRETACHHTRENVFGIYQGQVSTEISGVLLDGIQCTQSPVRYVYIDGGAFTTTGTRDITVKNIRGQQPLDSFIRVGGVATALTIDSLFMERFDVGTAVWTTTPFFFNSGVTVNKVFIDGKGSSISMDSSATQRYFIQGFATTNLPDIEITGFTLTNSAGASGSYMLQHNGPEKLVRIYNNRFYGLAQSMFGTPTGSPTIIIENNYADSQPILQIQSDAFYTLRNNKFGDSISIACFYAYGSAYTANIRAYNNDWGGATNWLNLYDSCTINLWWGGNYAKATFGTSIGFNGTNTVNLRASDAALPVDASKFTSIDSGCVFQNSNASFRKGVGVYTQGTNDLITTTVAGLPAASIGSGYKAFVTDANATTFQSIVAGGGANKVPVYSDGTNWRIG